MSLRWLVEVRKDKGRWAAWAPAAILALGVALFLSVLWLDGLLRYVHDSEAALVMLIGFALLAMGWLQWRTPTLLGWLIIFTPILVCLLEFGILDGAKNYEIRTAVLLVAGSSVAVLWLFRPRTGNVGQALTLSLVCLIFCGTIFAAERHYREVKAPLRSPPLTIFPNEHDRTASNKVLAGHFETVTRMAQLPEVIQWRYRENGGGRFVMADPGERFEATDYITDESTPRMRLIFAGGSGDSFFVHYEAGGFAHTYHVDVYELPSGKPLWRSYAGGKARNVEDLRKQLEIEPCCNPK